MLPDGRPFGEARELLCIKIACTGFTGRRILDICPSETGAEILTARSNDPNPKPAPLYTYQC